MIDLFPQLIINKCFVWHSKTLVKQMRNKSMMRIKFKMLFIRVDAFGRLDIFVSIQYINKSASFSIK